MSGPIVRSGPSPEYSNNWDEVFGSKKDSKEPSDERDDQASQAKLESDDSA